MNCLYRFLFFSNIISSVIIFSGCKSDNNDRYVEQFPEQFLLVGNEIGPENYFASPYLFNQIDSFLFIADSKLYKKNGHIVYVLNTRTYEVIDSLFYHGKGPEEFIYIIDIKVDREKNLWVFDDIKKQLSFFNYSDIGSFISLNQLHLPINSFGMYKFCVINDSLFVGSGNINDSRLIFFDKNENVVKKSGKYPYGVHYNTGEAQMVYNHKNKRIVLAYNLFDIIQIYNDKGDLLNTIRLKTKSSFKTKELSNDEYQYKICYHSLFTTDNYIYALYCGKKMIPGDDSWKQGNYIQVFTLDGHPYRVYKLNQPIVAFTVDEDSGIIYGINKFSNKPLTVFKINEKV